jgi:1-acyl-sn-glycerol-3-phosphate acyltransferase
MIVFLLDKIAHITHELRGLENLPKDTPFIIAAKHQSAWDTAIYHQVVYDPALVMKKELMRIPLYNWYVERLEMIEVDRKAGHRALFALLRGAKKSLAAQRCVVIFPEGTRTLPGQEIPYQTGVAALYELGVPLVPAATNSGVYWGRHSFLRPAGRMVLEFLPPIKPGLSRAEFMKELTHQIETSSKNLLISSPPYGAEQVI